ncbi:uncharacterized protein LOC113679671 [Pocillopora damicornis]|uniref:uncharacterized protein LOC113679671 n=1 Tax=Pocillopora damicornis TaxID=46731 RepID=UPI000F554897|nr:uncharacterized protein LOC113679671 [Pocillopora damicornis]
MLFLVCLLLFEACAVSISPMINRNMERDSIRDNSDPENHESSMVQARYARGKNKTCTYRNKEYKPGAKVDINLGPDYARCDRCTCTKKGKFRKCTKLYYCEVGFLKCKVEDYEWLPGKCCPECKRKSCTDDRKVGEKWERIKSMTGQNKGICSLCECLADGEEFCRDSRFICFDLPGCLETEIKPDFCCPQCKTWAKSTTTDAPSFTIILTEPTEPPPFPHFPFDSNEDKET